MSNSFDFELVADDRVSGTIDEINEAIKNLLPHLDEAQEKLNLGGDETVDSLDDVGGRLDKMSRSARDNVQLIGDIIPPLKIVGELAGKVAGFGAAGVVGFGVQKVADGFRDAAKGAYDLETHAKNTAMSVKDFSALSGAMRILGADSESSAASIEGFFKALNEANSAKNPGFMNAMSQIGAQIEKNKDGSVNALKTLESIAKIFSTLRPDQQKSAADGLSMTPELLALMREGANYKNLLAKADKFGLTVDPEFNKEMSEANRQMNELYARVAGFKTVAGNETIKLFRHDPAIDKSLNDAQKYDGKVFYHGDRDKDIRWKALRDDEFKASLSASERLNFTLNRPDPEVEKKLNARYGAMWQAYRLQDDLSVISAPKISGNEKIPYNDGHNASNTPGFRNHNPGNLKAAPNSTGKSGEFSTFASDADGLAAMARQLMLYGDRGNNTPNGIIHTYAPRTENNTRAYIDDVTSRTGFGAGQRLDLHNPEVLKTLMASMIRHEQGSQPYTEEQLKNAIRTAITDDRWSGKRSPELLSQQRNNINSMPTGGYRPESILAPKKSNSDLNTVTDNLARSLKDAFTEQPLRLEIVMTNDKGERKTYNVENNGKIITPMNY
ncbi:TPA: hypothetical protein ND549_002668 [Klebsiella michiganensis]|jgi:hypothetical protein|uniref:hypothetical protein n=1 Tax=Klebsiella TaxID=570 RepID=UPI0007CD3610|nr:MULTISPECIES: hypothetical protein [Klebsiella]DAT80832.1 MAG TPA: virion protein [Caudoviricetes sp.]HBZ8082526.1 hypothetical protein [Klebsiella quasipneumoniae subsp. similipneumoniae]AVR36017.1 bacteriophage coat protein [Klebsiella quasipneumoniae]QAS66184.1 hypothetical protein KOCBH_03705 [Klebsiella michiganensis]SAT74928.1 putative transmembrane protein [Klebsiella variicola]